MGMSYLKNHNCFNSVMTFIMLRKTISITSLVLTREKYYQHFRFKLHHLLNVICVCMHAHTPAHGDTVRPSLSAHEYL
jgi:hypothetical protein